MPKEVLTSVTNIPRFLLLLTGGLRFLRNTRYIFGDIFGSCCFLSCCCKLCLCFLLSLFSCSKLQPPDGRYARKLHLTGAVGPPARTLVNLCVPAAASLYFTTPRVLGAPLFIGIFIGSTAVFFSRTDATLQSSEPGCASSLAILVFCKLIIPLVS